jgi:hypothetical protein
MKDGSLFGFAGCMEEGQIIFDALRMGALPKTECKETSALHIRKDGSIWFTTGKAWIRVRGTRFTAIGTGSAFAIAAMKGGAQAEQAVRIAMELDPYSGGRVRKLKL